MPNKNHLSQFFSKPTQEEKWALPFYEYDRRKNIMNPKFCKKKLQIRIRTLKNRVIFSCESERLALMHIRFSNTIHQIVQLVTDCKDYKVEGKPSENYFICPDGSKVKYTEGMTPTFYRKKIHEILNKQARNHFTAYEAVIGILNVLRLNTKDDAKEISRLLNQTGHHKQTLMHFFATTGDYGAIKLLVECGCDINAADYDLTTPIHAMFDFKGERPVCLPNLKLLEFLYDNGAGFMTKDDQEMTPLTLAINSLYHYPDKILDFLRFFVFLFKKELVDKDELIDLLNYEMRLNRVDAMVQQILQGFCEELNIQNELLFFEQEQQEPPPIMAASPVNNYVYK